MSSREKVYLIAAADAEQHRVALAGGGGNENAVQLRRLFQLKGAYEEELDRCGRCGAKEKDHPAVHYYGMRRGTCDEWTQKRAT